MTDDLATLRAEVVRLRRALARARRGWDPPRRSDVGSRRLPYQRLMAALASGPLPICLLVQEVYGHDRVDADEARRRRQCMQRLLTLRARRGEIVRVGNGVYALPGKTDGMRLRTQADCLALLTDPGGLTVFELADRLEAPVATVHCWLSRLRDRGHRIVGEPQPRVAGGRGWPPRKWRVAV